MLWHNDFWNVPANLNLSKAIKIHNLSYRPLYNSIVQYTIRNSTILHFAIEIFYIHSWWWQPLKPLASGSYA